MNHTAYIESKIYNSFNIELQRKLAYIRFKNQKIVFTNGCFDILHKGHADYLSKAASLGEFLIIGLNSDASVKRLKGENRPVNNQENRAFILASLSFVSAVVVFEEDTPLTLLQAITPNVLVKGADYSVNTVVGSDYVMEKGGEVFLIDLVPGLSTTETIRKMNE